MTQQPSYHTFPSPLPQRFSHAIELPTQPAMLHPMMAHDLPFDDTPGPIIVPPLAPPLYAILSYQPSSLCKVAPDSPPSLTRAPNPIYYPPTSAHLHSPSILPSSPSIIHMSSLSPNVLIFSPSSSLPSAQYHCPPLGPSLIDGPLAYLSPFSLDYPLRLPFSPSSTILSPLAQNPPPPSLIAAFTCPTPPLMPLSSIILPTPLSFGLTRAKYDHHPMLLQPLPKGCLHPPPFDWSPSASPPPPSPCNPSRPPFPSSCSTTFLLQPASFPSSNPSTPMVSRRCSNSRQALAHPATSPLPSPIPFLPMHLSTYHFSSAPGHFRPTLHPFLLKPLLPLLPSSGPIQSLKPNFFSPPPYLIPFLPL
ncbi:hypothetical protein AMTRI_Chr10g3740 [Amborella trichopoda]